VAKDRPKLRESKPDPNAVASGTPQMPKRGADGFVIFPPGPQMMTSLGRGMIRVEAQQKSIVDLVNGMGRLIAQGLGVDPTDFASRKPRVTDKTALTGQCDFRLEFSCEGCRSLGANLPPMVGRGPADAPRQPSHWTAACRTSSWRSQGNGG
jgi:uncharacterized protein (TIGR03435 family)